MTRFRAEALISWSSGKDAAWALHMARQNAELEVVGLLTTFNGEFDRVSMQGVRRELVKAQASELGLPLWEIDLPWPCPNEVYEARMGEAMARAVEVGVSGVIFGDLFLEEVRSYRVDRLAGSGIEPIFPIWGLPTADLAREMLDGGLGAVITAVDTTQLDSSFAGRPFDRRFLSDLPEEVDPLGEKGEFHTFCYAAPSFSRPIDCGVGEVVERGRFTYADVVPV